ncbi:MAG: hypothetical protein ACE5NP_01935 [Anaerolineae bacterium]
MARRVLGLILVLLAMALLVGPATGVLAQAGSDSGDVTVSVTSNPKITLEIDVATAAFGAVDPGATYTATPDISGRVKANVFTDFTGTAPAGLDNAPPTASIAITNLSWNGTPFAAGSNTFWTNQGRGVNNYAHTYTLLVPWDVPPDSYSGTITYTASQTP